MIPIKDKYINSSISNNSNLYEYIFFFAYTQLNVKTVLFQTIQLCISTQFQWQKEVSFQTIQFSISTQVQCQKQFFFKQFSLA